MSLKQHIIKFKQNFVSSFNKKKSEFDKVSNEVNYENSKVAENYRFLLKFAEINDFDCKIIVDDMDSFCADDLPQAYIHYIEGTKYMAPQPILQRYIKNSSFRIYLSKNRVMNSFSISPFLWFERNIIQFYCKNMKEEIEYELTKLRTT